MKTMRECGRNDTNYCLSNPKAGGDKDKYITETLAVLASGKGHPEYNKGVTDALRGHFAARGQDLDELILTAANQCQKPATT